MCAPSSDWEKICRRQKKFPTTTLFKTTLVPPHVACGIDYSWPFVEFRIEHLMGLWHEIDRLWLEKRREGLFRGPVVIANLPPDVLDGRSDQKELSV